jgi:hypothetical protein
MTLQEIRSWYHARPGYWFRPKLFGFGAVPVAWQGWALTFGLVVAAATIGNLAQHRATVYAALLLPLVTGFLYLCWAKTDGDWRWRWGDTDS